MDIVAARFQIGTDRIVELAFQMQTVGLLRVGKARGIPCRLRIGAKQQHVDQHLCLALRLLIAIHHAERGKRLVIASHKAGDDSVKWPLARRDGIGAARIERKRRRAVVEHKAIARRGHP